MKKLTKMIRFPATCLMYEGRPLSSGRCLLLACFARLVRNGSLLLFIMAILTGCSPSSQDVSINTTKKTDGMHSIVASATIEPASNPIISSRKLPPDMEAESEIPFLNNPNILSTAKTFYISPVDRIKLAEAGENGDGEAAFKLAQFYNFSVKNPELERHWLRISATNDHLVGQYNLAYTLINWGTSAEEKEEGMQLMRKYANNGNEHAIIFFRQREYQKKHNNS